VRIDAVDPKWSGSLKIGLTTLNISGMHSNGITCATNSDADPNYFYSDSDPQKFFVGDRTDSDSDTDFVGI
jgi:hypothetical protein